MIRINMLREARGGKRPVGAGPRPAAVAVPSEGAPPYGIYVTLILLTLLVILAWAGVLIVKNRALATQIAQQREELKKYEGAREKVAELEKKKQEFSTKVQQITELKDQQSVPVKLMNRLVEVLPDGAWYTTVSQGGGRLINIEGQAKSIKIISTYYDNLVATPEFGEVQQGDITQITGAGEEVYTFKVGCNYYPGGVRPKPVETAPAAAAPAARRKASADDSSGME
jgi:Tfp pilus assembly protein PilN